MKQAAKQPLLGYGTYKLTNQSIEHLKALLWAAYESGYDYIDTASYYHNEAQIGQALKELKHDKKIDFHFPIQTKVWPKDYLQTRQSVLNSLQNLQAPYLDSVLLHRPAFNLAHDIYAWKTLIQLQKEGLIKHIGVSNYDLEMIKLLIQFTQKVPEYNQIQYNIYLARVDRYLANQNLNIQVQAWRPLTQDLNELTNDVVVQQLANKYQTTPTGIALAFCKKLNISPIVKSAQIQRIYQNAQAYFEVNLSDADLQKLQQLNQYFLDLGSNFSATYGLSDPQLIEELETELAQLSQKVEK